MSSVFSRANFTCALKTTGASGRNVGKKVFFFFKLVYIVMAPTEKRSLNCFDVFHSCSCGTVYQMMSL